MCGNHESPLSRFTRDEIVRPELDCWLRLGFDNAHRILGDCFGRPTYAELKNSGDHDNRPRVASILSHREAERFGTVDKETTT
jgi:hypothetical protein